jgi:hypothetical protein
LIVYLAAIVWQPWRWNIARTPKLATAAAAVPQAESA